VKVTTGSPSSGQHTIKQTQQRHVQLVLELECVTARNYTVHHRSV